MGPLYGSTSSGLRKTLAAEPNDGKKDVQQVIDIALVEGALIHEALQLLALDFGGIRHSAYTWVQEVEQYWIENAINSQCFVDAQSDAYRR